MDTYISTEFLRAMFTAISIELSTNRPIPVVSSFAAETLNYPFVLQCRQILTSPASLIIMTNGRVD